MDTDGAPKVPKGREGTNEDPSVPDGPAENVDEFSAESSGSTSTEGSSSDSGASRTTGGRKRRVKVTPKDWDALEQASNRLGVGYATVYRIAFQQYLRKLEE
jgi:hypothetical protein